MTQWTRTIGRVVANAVPAWRAAMTQTNALYEIGGLPGDTLATIQWPAAGANNFQMNGGSDGNAHMLHPAYGGSVWAQDVGGPFGSMIFGRTGEGTIDNQMTMFTLSADSPVWAWYQQPDYAITLAEAVARDADWYYSVADYNALPAGNKIPTGDASGWVASWDKTFPIGFSNWVGRRKYQTSITGNSRPHQFRYDMPRWIPSSMTGTGAGAIIVTNYGTIYGPFGQGQTPNTALDADWFAELDGATRKRWIWAMNTQSKAWQRLATPLPAGLQHYSIMMPLSCLDAANKFVWYWIGQSSANKLLRLDFTAGLVGMTPTILNLTDLSSGAQSSFSGNDVLCVPESGALAGKRLWFCKDSGGTQLILIDIDNLTMRKLAVGGLPASGDWWCFSYDATNNVVYITTKHTSFGVRSYRFAIPTDYTNAAAYSVSMQQVALNGVTLESFGDGSPWQYGERTRYLPALGVILMTQRHNRMLGYRPA